MKWKLGRLARVAVALAAYVGVCSPVFGQWRLAIKPEDAFSDPRQVALATAAKAGNVKAIELSGDRARLRFGMRWWRVRKRRLPACWNSGPIPTRETVQENPCSGGA